MVTIEAGGALRGVGGRLPEVVEGVETEDPKDPFPPDPRIERCREQNPLRWDSFVQPSLEHNRRHCFPLNFFLIPFGAATMSPFLNL